PCPMLCATSSEHGAHFVPTPGSRTGPRPVPRPCSTPVPSPVPRPFSTPVRRSPDSEETTHDPFRFIRSVHPRPAGDPLRGELTRASLRQRGRHPAVHHL